MDKYACAILEGRVDEIHDPQGTHFPGNDVRGPHLTSFSGSLSIGLHEYMLIRLKKVSEEGGVFPESDAFRFLCWMVASHFIILSYKNKIDGRLYFLRWLRGATS